MADEEKTTVEVAEGDGQADPKKGNKMILFGGIGLAVIVLGVVLALFVIKPMMADDTAKADTEQIEGEDGSHEESGEDADSEDEMVDTNSPEVINMARLLQSLDSEGSPQDGILISPAVVGAFEAAMEEVGLDVIPFSDDVLIKELIQIILCMLTGCFKIPCIKYKLYLRE